MSLYEVLKASKTQQFPDYWTLLWGRKLSASMIKTLTGTLPLTFTAKAGAADTWTIYGNAQGVGERTKNLIEITTESQTRDGATLTSDHQTGTAILSGDTTEATSGFSLSLLDTSSLVGGDYIFSGGADGGSTTTYDLYLYNRTDQVIMGRLYNSSDAITVTIESGKRYMAYVQCRRGQVYNDIVFKPMLRPADTTSDFIPYGYQVPITVSQDEENYKNYEIFIGDAPLAEGETVSKTSTGIDIELFEGENTVSTTLTNKPEMTIKYK